MKRVWITALAVLFGLTLGSGGSILEAGTVSYVPITNDADSEIDSAKFYTHVLDFGTHDPGALVGGVQFRRTQISTLPANFSYEVNTGTRNDHGGNAGHNVAPGSGVENLFYGMIYNSGTAGGGIATLTLRGLQVGQQYDTRIYTRQWSPGSRTAIIRFDTNVDGVAEDQVTISEDDATQTPPGFATSNQAYALSYQFTADSPELTITFAHQTPPASWHVYGLSNELVGPPPFGVFNGSFEADTFYEWPGYITRSGYRSNGAISG